MSKIDEQACKDSALIVNEGIEQPPITNPYINNFFKKSAYFRILIVGN